MTVNKCIVYCYDILYDVKRVYMFSGIVRKLFGE